MSDAMRTREAILRVAQQLAVADTRGCLRREAITIQRMRKELADDFFINVQQPVAIDIAILFSTNRPADTSTAFTVRSRSEDLASNP
jgi:hypothetical protein